MNLSDYIYASNGDGEAVRAFIVTERDIGNMDIITDSVLNFPQKFIATTGTLDVTTGLLDEGTMTIMKCHLDGSIIVIDEFAPGYPDMGNTVDQIVILKPTTLWADSVAQAIEQAGVITVSPTAPVSPEAGDFWLDESESGGTAVDISSVQTLTNKSLSGAANTFSNIPTSAIAATPFHSYVSVPAFTITATTSADVTGGSISLPEAGTYRISGYIRNKSVSTSGVSYISMSLYDTLTAATITDSEILGATCNGAITLWATTPIRAIITTAGATTIKLQARKAGSLTATIEGDSNGRSVIFAERLFF